jgi:hypothetical protein
VRATSTNTLGFFLWTVAITAVSWIATFAARVVQLKREKRERPFKGAIGDSLLPALFEVVAIAVLVACLWGVFVVRAVYDDHEESIHKIDELRGYEKDKQKFQDDLRYARADAEHWHNAYSGSSRSDIHPDRVLNSEESNKLFDELKRVSQEAGNKDYIKVEIGNVTDREALHLERQLFNVLYEAHWKIKTREKMGEDFDDYNKAYPFPVGVAVWSDDQSRATYLAWMLRDGGLSDVYSNPTGPAKFKGVLIWIGYKQWP